jgi:hypothetical protein
MALEDYTFRVEELTAPGELVRVLVYADHPIIARAALAAVEQYPKARIRLRNRALVMESKDRKDLCWHRALRGVAFRSTPTWSILSCLDG